jgi:hypothetical protein
MTPLVPACFGLRDGTIALSETLRPFHVSNSYGLFRRMTGVGPRESRGVPARWGWGGLPPSIVQVPVVVLEANAHATDDGAGAEGWREIPFRYTPFGEHRAPRRTAPHQPRLDWQMWCAVEATHDRQRTPLCRRTPIAPRERAARHTAARA